MKHTLAFWMALAIFAQAEKLKFDSLLKEISASPEAKTVVTDFKFTNASNKPVTITKSDPGCSCLHVQVQGGKLTYAPGEDGLIRTTFDMGNFSGTVDKVVAVWLDDDPQDHPSLRLTSRVHIPVLVNLEPKTVAWEIGAKPSPQVIAIKMMEGQEIHVKGVSSSNPVFACTLATVKEGSEYKLTVIPAATDKAGIAVIRIETDAKSAKHRLAQAFGVVRKNAAGVQQASSR